jgi:hypothetical protein
MLQAPALPNTTGNLVQFTSEQLGAKVVYLCGKFAYFPQFEVLAVEADFDPFPRARSHCIHLPSGPVLESWIGFLASILLIPISAF